MDEREFKQYIHGEFVVDETFEFFVEAWTAYHKAADLVDGHIKWPRNSTEHRLVMEGALAGSSAMANYFKRHSFDRSSLRYHPELKVRFDSAKYEALRRLGKS